MHVPATQLLSVRIKLACSVCCAHPPCAEGSDAASIVILVVYPKLQISFRLLFCSEPLDEFFTVPAQHKDRGISNANPGFACGPCSQDIARSEGTSAWFSECTGAAMQQLLQLPRSGRGVAGASGRPGVTAMCCHQTAIRPLSSWKGGSQLHQHILSS